MMRLLLVLLVIGLNACTMAPDYGRPVVDAGKEWKGSTTTLTLVSMTWWQDYKLTTLNTLVEQALQANNDLAASLQRIEQARRSVSKSQATLFPQLNASGSEAKNWRDANGTTTTSESNNVGLSVSYELDLFGRNRSNTASSEAKLEASSFDFESLKIITAANVATAYAQTLATTERLRVAQDNLSIANDILGIITARFREGAASALELSQQKSSVESSKATIASLVAQHDSYINQLAVLTGKAPQIFKLSEDGFSKWAVPHIIPNPPAQLLEQRPDIRRAEASLIAANADIGAARAAFYPSLNLGADAILNGNPASTVLSLTASALAHIFSGGALEGDLAISEARKEELVASYRQTVLTAFQEVSDALSAVRAADSRVTALTVATQESRKAYKLARMRYDSGSIDFQTMLDTQRTLLQAEDSAIQAHLEQVQASINLNKALGGGWSTSSH